MKPTQSKSKLAKRRQDTASNDFYETMPLSAPHSIFRDDTDYNYDVEQSDRDEVASAGRHITALVTLAVVLIAVLGLAILIAYGLGTLGSVTSPANVASGSLEL